MQGMTKTKSTCCYCGVGCGVIIESEGGRITGAGGFLVQAMPGATTAELKSIEQHIQEIESLASRVAEDKNPLSLLSQIFQE